MEAQCDDGWGRCRRRKSDQAAAVKIEMDTETHAAAATATTIESLMEASLPTMERIGNASLSMTALSMPTCSLWSSVAETGSVAALTTSSLKMFPVNIKQQNNHHQQQQQQQQRNPKNQTSTIIISIGRKQRNNYCRRNIKQHHALWILNLIVHGLLAGRRFCCGYWYCCSAFQQQRHHQQQQKQLLRLRKHHTLTNLQKPKDNNAVISIQNPRMSLQKLLFSPVNQREQLQLNQPCSISNHPHRPTTTTSTTTTTTTINNYSKNKSNPTNKIEKDEALVQLPKTGPKQQQQQQQRRKQYRRKLPLSPSEKSAALNRQKRRAAYETMRSKSLATTNAPPSMWSFDSLFAAPVLDEKSIREDLFGTKQREAEMIRERATRKRMLLERRKERDCSLRGGEDGSDLGGVGSDGRVVREGVGESTTATAPGEESGAGVKNARSGSRSVEAAATVAKALQKDGESTKQTIVHSDELEVSGNGLDIVGEDKDRMPNNDDEPRLPVDKVLTRMVQDRMYGLTRSPAGSIQYSSSLLDSGRAVQFRDGVRLGKALTINIDRLCYFAKKDFSHGRLEEAQEYYIKARNMDPTDGRPYLGLSRIAQRRGDYEAARALLKEGIAKSSGGFVVVKGQGGAGGGDSSMEKGSKNGRRGDSSKDVDLEDEDETTIGTIPDIGPNPFLLQALGTLEQQVGQLAAAEELYLQAIRSRPSHAAAWVSLAQLRTKELRQGASAGRACYQSAERELQRIGAKPNSFVYTAWASMEYKKGSREDDVRCVQKARELYQKALNVDPQCSAAYLQLGVMESECGNFDEAKMCFEKVLKFDQRNSRVLQAYAVMESRRAPKDKVDSRQVLDLFERALKANQRDAGVYQAYALYVAELGDIDAARNLFQKATEVNKRHAPAWTAWGVLETRYSTAKAARDVFQQGIWSCARPGGGQSGGRDCARLWQAWGILEAQEGDHAAARRCFSRALDADKRNAAAVTAWTLMEAELGNFADARSIFERVLKLFSSPSVDKTAIWRAYEVMEERAGNTREAQLVFQRSMRESISSSTADEELLFPFVDGDIGTTTSDLRATQKSEPFNKSREVEVSSWSNGSDVLGAEVWMNNGSIEGKVPASMMKKFKNRRL